jgi:putative endonuclease
MAFKLKRSSKESYTIAKNTTPNFYVYMVECLDWSYYTGYTPNLSNRIMQHKHGKGSKYIIAKGYKKLVYFETHQIKEIAMKREFSIKNAGRIYKKELIEKFQKDILLLRG